MLIPLDTEVLGLFLSKSASDATKLTALASSDFTRDRSPGAALGVVSGTGLLRAVRGVGSAVTIYSGAQTGAWAAGLDCTFPDEPAATYFLLEKVPPVGSAVALTSGASVFIGDAVRIYPRVTPPATTQPLTDWRFDYDYHAGSAAEADLVYPRVKQPDLCKSCTGGASTPPASLDLVGPCDPRNTTPTAPNPATGAGCWVSVTTNGLQGGPDFASATAPVAATLSFGLEARNALNGLNGAPTSGLTTFSLVWNVPQPRVLSSSIFWGGALQDGSDGSPDTSSAAWEWYFAPTAGAANLVRDLGCTGSTCAHVFPGKGSFGYFLRVPYRGGYVTPDCTRANGACTNALGTIVVTDVSLALTAPSSVFRTEAVIPVASQSRKSAAVTGSFSYEICPSPCSTTPVSGTASLTGDPFAISGGGYVNVPMPTTAGTYDLRLTYSYVGPADCASAPCKAYWPSQTGWTQVLVSNAMPDIRLLSTTGASLCFGSACDIYTGDTGHAYTYVNGVLDPAPPAGMKWLWGDGSSSDTGPSAQGAPFSYSTAGSYTITLQGYGADYHKTIYVTDMPVHDPPTVSAVTFSRTKPAVGEHVGVSCLASRGTYAIGSYHISFGDGRELHGAAPSVSHTWASEGTKSVGCTAIDVYDLASETRYALIDVGGPDVGPTVTAIDVTPDVLVPGTSATLTCSATAPAGRLVAGYEFDFGDSSPTVNGPSSSASHVYLTAGSYPATCRAYDASGRSGSLQRDVVVYEPSYPLQVTRIGSGSGLVYSTPPGLSCGSDCSTVIATGSSVVLDTLAGGGLAVRGLERVRLRGHRPLHRPRHRRTARDGELPSRDRDELRSRDAVPCGRHPDRRRSARRRRGPGVPRGRERLRRPVYGAGGRHERHRHPALGRRVPWRSSLPAPRRPARRPSPSRRAGPEPRPTIVQIGNGGAVSVYNGSTGTVHVILDVVRRLPVAAGEHLRRGEPAHESVALAGREVRAQCAGARAPLLTSLPP